MAKEVVLCPNCRIELKEGFVSSVELLPNPKAQVINEKNDLKTAGYCTKCGPEKYKIASAQIKSEYQELVKGISDIIYAIPIVTIDSPKGWDYEIMGMVTEQSTTGTGFLSEFSASVTDLFGKQSQAYNSKIKHGENLCAAQLRMHALEAGGNAVVGTDVDFAELGFEKGMIMVCMAGTAVKLLNPEILSEERVEKLATLKTLHAREKYLRPFVNYINLP